MSEPYEKSNDRSFRITDQKYDDFAGDDAYEQQADYPAEFNVKWTDSLFGVKNPVWRHLVREGNDATTPMTAFRKDISQTPGRFVCIGNTHPSLLPQYRKKVILQGCIGGVPSTSLNTVGVPQGEAAAVAAGRWYGKVRDAMSGFKGSIFAAESRQARSMMKDRAERMLTKIPAFQRLLHKQWLRSKTKRGKLKTLSNSWLELQFGWLPLASDIEDAYKVLQDPPKQFKLIRVAAQHKDVESYVSGENASGIAAWSTDTRVTTEYEVSYKGCVKARADPSGDKLLDFGLGVREFLPTLWEVIPWSFAVDYFTNVSEIINAISYASAEVTWSKRTIRSSRTLTQTSHHYFSSTIPLHEKAVHIDMPSVFVVKASRVDRQAATVPIPGLVWQLPNAKQTLNLAALAVSRRLRLSY